ncbi:predicted protein [Histoplasma capsulatum var. duboisii H88]|uniref:Predicted protein n=2 Tax=Ajellomyces capsulatus TaxID=5037 RepID=F0UKQ5_AJEC8|nr:predicted protein [Histoplasma capsulatum H143]EGC46009.1 predicted protein [Histoplasma capsulatum var. duboisii H88]
MRAVCLMRIARSNLCKTSSSIPQTSSLQCLWDSGAWESIPMLRWPPPLTLMRSSMTSHGQSLVSGGALRTLGCSAPSTDPHLRHLMSRACSDLSLFMGTRLSTMRLETIGRGAVGIKEMRTKAWASLCSGETTASPLTHGPLLSSLSSYEDGINYEKIAVFLVFRNTRSRKYSDFDQYKSHFSTLTTVLRISRGVNSSRVTRVIRFSPLFTNSRIWTIQIALRLSIWHISMDPKRPKASSYLFYCMG